VIEEELKTEAELHRFLLGEMSENERSAFEEKFVADEDLFAQILVAEDELIESYVRGTLSVTEKEKFERSFLTSETRRERVRFTRAMLAKLNQHSIAEKTEIAVEDSSVWYSITNFFKTPKFAFGAVFTLLILVFASWFLLKNPNQPEIARQITPTPTVQITPNPNQSARVNQNDSVNSATNVSEKIPVNKNASQTRGNTNQNQNANPPKQESSVAAPVIALFAGTVRSEGKTQELNLPKNASGANLQLKLESSDYKIYLVEIVDANGNVILKNDNLKAQNSKLNLFVSAQKLQKGDYMIKVSALNPQNEIESVADYSFRVNRK
jgi:hypothetical protein